MSAGRSGRARVPMRTMRVRWGRLPWVGLAGLALLAGLLAGLVRLGSLPLSAPSSVLPLGLEFGFRHGPWMLAFLGTLIALERAVALEALKERWGYLVPALSGLGALLLLVGLEGASAALLVLAAVGLLGIYARLLLLPHGRFFTLTMALGAAGWLMGNLLWFLDRPLWESSLGWLSFPVLTIVGERLELSRLRRLSPVALGGFGIALGAFGAGLLLTPGEGLPGGLRLMGWGTVALTLWLLGHDVALRTVHQRGLPRYIALCLLAGYAWLFVGGLLLLRYGLSQYDAFLHVVFLGFVFSMIFGHAPIIFPALLGVRIPFRAAFYVHWGLLHLSLVLRVVGDLAGWEAGRRGGGLLGVIAILLFLGNTLRAALSAPRRGREPTP